MFELIDNTEKKSRESSAGDWYVVYTKALLEISAQEHLHRQGFETYLPLIETQQRRQGQLISLIKPFFPRYLFIRFNRESDDWSPVRSTRGVCGLVKFEGVPKPIPASLISGLKSNEDARQLQQFAKPAWKAGDTVAIEQGPFAGYSCIFQARRSESLSLY
jgi:transcriptional antiterminator RfaH